MASLLCDGPMCIGGPSDTNINSIFGTNAVRLAIPAASFSINIIIICFSHSQPELVSFFFFPLRILSPLSVHRRHFWYTVPNITYIIGGHA